MGEADTQLARSHQDETACTTNHFPAQRWTKEEPPLCKASLKYTFVQKAIERKPYSELVERLSAIVDQLKEDTDPNDDVSFGFLLTKGVEQLFVQLSMVGKFAAVQRVHRSGFNQLVDAGNARSDFEKSVVGQLKMADVIVLDDALLTTAFPFHLVNAEHIRATVYQALFSDNESVPWS